MIKEFKNEIFSLSVQSDGGENLFNAEDVARALGFTQTKNGKEYVKWERLNGYLPNSPEVGKGSFISEPMVYKLAFKANNAVAEKFTDWLAIDVLPTIRQNGAYLTDQKAQDILSGNGLADLLLQAGNQIKKLESEKLNLQIELEEATEKTLYLDLILESTDKITVTQIAQDYGMSAIRFNEILRELRVQRKVNHQWILYSKYQAKGYIKSETINFLDRHGEARTKINTVWTQSGRMFLYKKLKSAGYLPLIEREEVA